MTSDADESWAQTFNVMRSALLRGDRAVSGAKIEQWLDYQRWLAIEAPYKVVIPFRLAILKAFKEHWERLKRRSENPKIQLRLRRDIHGMLTAIKTSAILHKAQRKKDARGRIVATVGDYRNAHASFDEGLASLYKLKTPVTALAVVKAIEEMGATEEDSVKVTVSYADVSEGSALVGVGATPLIASLMRRTVVFVTSWSTNSAGYGRTTPREYTIGRSSEAIEAEIKAGVGSGVFPPAESGENCLRKGTHPLGTTVQAVQ